MRYQHNKGLEKWQSWRVEKRVRETKIPSQLCVPLPRPPVLPSQLSIKAAPAHD